MEVRAERTREAPYMQPKFKASGTLGASSGGAGSLSRFVRLLCSFRHMVITSCTLSPSSELEVMSVCAHPHHRAPSPTPVCAADTCLGGHAVFGAVVFISCVVVVCVLCRPEYWGDGNARDIRPPTDVVSRQGWWCAPATVTPRIRCCIIILSNQVITDACLPFPC